MVGVLSAIGGLGSLAGGLIGSSKAKKEAGKYDRRMTKYGDSLWKTFTGTTDTYFVVPKRPDGSLDWTNVLYKGRENQAEYVLGEQARLGNANYEVVQGEAPGIAEDFDPYVEKGLEAFERKFELLTGDDYSLYRESPGYQFQLSEGEKAISRNALAKGVFGGARSKALMEYAGGMADQDFQNYLANLDTTTEQGMSALNTREGLRQWYKGGELELKAAGAGGSYSGGLLSGNLLAQGVTGGVNALGNIGNILGQNVPQQQQPSSSLAGGSQFASQNLDYLSTPRFGQDLSRYVSQNR